MTDERIFPEHRVTLVGVLNLTPDSFSDGGRFVGTHGDVDWSAAAEAGRALALAGAHVVDVGGESTRPGAATVPVAEEIRRTVRVVEALAKALPVPVSIDTRKAAVAEAALDAGARVVNDVSGGRHDPALLAVAARRGATVVLGHLRGEPATMQDAPRFDDVVGEVAAELAASVARARAAGIPDDRLAVDPGIGFGKTAAHNLALLANLGRLRAALGLPVLVGTSRKSFLGRLTGEGVGGRGEAGLAADAIAVFQGADAVRVHEVGPAARAVAVARALREARADG